MIIVVGSGRSGTTLVSRVLQEKLGVDMGGPGRKSASNPTGDYENREFRNNIDIPYYRNQIKYDEWAKRVKAFVERKEEPFGIKDPRNAHFIDKLLDLIPDAHVIWAQRDFEDTVDSWCKWYGGSMSRESAAEEIDSRLFDLGKGLGTHPYLPVDCTDWWDEDELAILLYEYLEKEGQEGLKTPG